MKKNLCFVKVLVIVFLMFLFVDLKVYATNSVNDSAMEYIDFEAIENSLKETQNKESFRQLFNKVLTGEIDFDIRYFLGYIKELIVGGLKENRGIFVQIIILVAVAALLGNFTDIFKNAHINNSCFYIVYLILITLLMKGIYASYGMVSETLNALLDFMKALIPSYMAVMTVTTGSVTSVFLYEVIMVVIYLVEWILLRIILPATSIYAVLMLVNSISKVDHLSKFTELIKSFVDWMLKFMMGAIISINVLQGLIAPLLDSMKRGIFTKAASAIPGVGNAINSVSKMIIGSGILIKNGIGVTALIFIIVICMIPYLKMVIITGGYKLIAAIIQPISDKRIIEGISGAGGTMEIMTKVVMTAGVLFMVTIALISVATGTNYG